MTNWLVTGGCGFIGSTLVTTLLERGEKVRIVDNMSVGKISSLPRSPEITAVEAVTEKFEDLQLVKADIRDAEAMRAVCQGADVAVHFAANTGVAPSVENPRMDCEVNVFGTLNLLEGARKHGVRRVVMASSGAPLAGNEPPLHEEMAARPMSPYGASKLAGEGYLMAYHGSYGIEGVALRFGNVYGPGSFAKESVVAKFIKHALSGEALEIYGDGSQTRDFVFIDDLIEVVIRAALTENIGGEVFQIATSRESTVQEIAEAIAEIIAEETGTSVPVTLSAPRAGDAARSVSDVSKARDMLGYAPQTELRDGIRQTVNYFLNLRSAA